MNKNALLAKIREEASVIGNYSVIFEKIIKDEYLDDFYDCLIKIFNKEIGFAIYGLLNRAKENEKNG